MEEAQNIGWSESNSETFLDHARYFVPEREEQMRTICDLLPAEASTLQVVDLCCGEGLLAGAILERYPQSTVHALDGSETMIEHARRALAPYGDRFHVEQFDLAASDWRTGLEEVDAVVSSLAIHHLDGNGKQALFRDIHRMLRPGGVVIIADIIEPAGERSRAFAAQAYDDVVRRQSIEFVGGTAAFDDFVEARWNLFRYPDYPFDQPSSIVDQLTWLREAGFVEVDVYWMKAGHAVFGGARRPAGETVDAPAADVVD